MSISFEVVHKDIMGRCGKLHVGEKTVKTPLLLPVVNPHIAGDGNRGNNYKCIYFQQK